MKRVSAIFMLFVMLVVGIGPTMGMHFCGNNLHSIEILSAPKSTSCCSQSANRALTHGECVEEMHKDCCDTQKLQIATDSFQQQERTINANNVFLTLTKDCLFTNVLFNSVAFDSISLIRKHFPPNGYDVKNLDVLGFICILRI